MGTLILSFEFWGEAGQVVCFRWVRGMMYVADFDDEGDFGLVGEWRSYKEVVGYYGGLDYPLALMTMRKS